MKILMLTLLLLAVGQATGQDALRSPAIMRAAARRDAAVTTNRMQRPVRVASQVIVSSNLVSTMTDGTQVSVPIRYAHTARLTPSGRDLRDAEVSALVTRLGADPANPRAVAAALAGHRAKLNILEAEAAKSAGKAGALGALAGLALGAAAAAKLKKTT